MVLEGAQRSTQRPHIPEDSAIESGSVFAVYSRSVLDNRLDNHFFERPPKGSKTTPRGSPHLARDF